MPESIVENPAIQLTSACPLCASPVELQRELSGLYRLKDGRLLQLCPACALIQHADFWSQLEDEPNAFLIDRLKVQLMLLERELRWCRAAMAAHAGNLVPAEYDRRSRERDALAGYVMQLRLLIISIAEDDADQVPDVVDLAPSRLRLLEPEVL